MPMDSSTVVMEHCPFMQVDTAVGEFTETRLLITPAANSSPSPENMSLCPIHKQIHIVSTICRLTKPTWWREFLEQNPRVHSVRPSNHTCFLERRIYPCRDVW